MQKYNFLPIWYEKEKIENKRKKVKRVIIATFLINLIFIICIYTNIKKIKNINTSILTLGNRESIIETNKLDTTEINKSSFESMKFFQYFKEINIKIIEFKIEGNNMELQIEVNSYDEYVRTIGELEKVEKISIYNIELPNLIKDKFIFKVYMEKRND